MKKIISAVLASVMIFGAMVGLSSCGEPKDAGAEISVYLGETIYDFDPTDYYANDNAAQLMSLLYEPLFKVNSKGEIKCAGASSYKVNEKERTIVINLRETYWSDEVRVKAADYIYAWRELILNPNNANPAAALFYGIENAAEIKAGVDGVSLYSFGAKDTGVYEITIKYNKNASYKQILKNLASIATSPARQDVVSVAQGYWSKSMSSIVTNGPFKLKELGVETGDLSLARNLGYHQKSTVTDYTEKVNPAELISFTTTAGQTLELTYADIANKTVFYMGDATLADRAANKSKAKTADLLSTYTYVFNTENELFAIKEVRQALSLALDRDAIASAITYAKAAKGFLPDKVAKSIYGKKVTSRLDESLTEAQALVDSVFASGGAGYGLSKSFTLTVNNDEESLAIALCAQSAWSTLGFDVTIKAVGYTSEVIVDSTTSEEITIVDSEIQRLVKEASYGNREFDVIGIDWQMYSTDAFVALSAFSSSLNGNGRDFSTGDNRLCIAGWWNSDYDSYINAAFSATKDSDRDAALKEAEKILLEECPVIAVVHNTNFAYTHKHLTKIGTDIFGNFSFTSAKLKNYEKYLSSDEE